MLAGPASPKALATWLDGSDRIRAGTLRGLGGASVNALTSALLEAGETVELVSLAMEVDEVVVLEGERLRILLAPYRARARHRARDFFRSERENVSMLVRMTSGRAVLANWTYEFALGALAVPGRPTVVIARDAPLTILRYTPDAYRAVRAALGAATRLKAAAIAANSPYLASAWRRQMLYRRPIHVLPNVVPLSGPRLSAPVVGTPPSILDVSDDGPRKNVAALVRAMPQILQTHDDVRLRLVGAGLTAKSPIAHLAERLNVRASIDFLGELDPEGVREEYLRATLFAHVSREESFGMSVAEAMSHALPVIGGTRAGAVPWVLDEGRAGLLADVRRPEAVAGAICRLLADPVLRSQFGAAAVERVRAEFSPAAVSQRTLALLEDLGPPVTSRSDRLRSFR